MAINPISLAESLRPFRAAGLSCFLDVVFGASEASDNADASPEANGAEGYASPGFPDARLPSTGSGGEHTERYSASPVVPSPREYAESDCRSAGGAEAFAGKEPSAVDARRADQMQPASMQRSAVSPREASSPAFSTPHAPGDASPSTPGPASALPAPAAWPPAWRELFSALRPAPVLWSYAELGLDLSGQGSTERSATLKQIIGTLQLPRGTSVFWPQYLPGESGEQCSGAVCSTVSPLAYFASGLELLSPKTVILLGCSEALAEEFGFANAAPYSQRIVRGRLYIHLPDMAQLTVDAQLVERACIFLRNALTAYPSLFRQK